MMMNKVVRRVSPAVPAAARPMAPRRAPVRVLAAAPAAQSLTGKPIEKLKRAPSPFNLFYKAKFAQTRADLKAKGKEGTLAECAKALRELWDKLPEAQKQPFVQQAETVKAEFEKAKAAGLIAGAKPKPVDPAGPKPLTVYAAFVKAQFAGTKKAHPTKSTAEIAKVIAEQWKALDNSKKDALKAQYNKELAAYHARQEALGTAPKPAAAKAAPKAAAPAPKAAAAPPPAAKRTSPAPSAAAKAPAPPSRGPTPPKRTSPTK